MITFRHFPADEDFGAYDACTAWLRAIGCSVASMQDGYPTAVMFWPGIRIAKYRDLSQRQAGEVHGWISPDGRGSFRGRAVAFEIAAAGAKALAREGAMA